MWEIIESLCPPLPGSQKAGHNRRHQTSGHKAAVVEGVSGHRLLGGQVQRSAQPKGGRHRLVDTLYTAGHHVVEEDDRKEDWQVFDGLVARDVLFAAGVVLVVAWHLVRQAGQYKESQAEHDAPRTLTVCIIV